MIRKSEARLFVRPDRENYLKLIKNIEDKNFSEDIVLLDGIIKEMEEEGFYIHSHITDILNNCPYMALNKSELADDHPLKKKQRMIEEYYTDSKGGDNLIMNFYRFNFK